VPLTPKKDFLSRTPPTSTNHGGAPSEGAPLTCCRRLIVDRSTNNHTRAVCSRLSWWMPVVLKLRARRPKLLGLAMREVQCDGADDSTVRALAQNVAETLRRENISAAGQRRVAGLETVDFDGLGIELKTFLLVGEEILNVLALVALELDYLTHLCVVDDRSIASELLLDHLENLLLVKLLRKTLDSGQGFASIALLDAYMDIILRLLYFSYVVNIDEGVVGLEVFDGHKLGVTGVTRGKRVLKGVVTVRVFSDLINGALVKVEVVEVLLEVLVTIETECCSRARSAI
jgi:hypothetical protein